MITEAERNYETKNWEPLANLPTTAEPLTLVDTYHICNTSSQAFQDIVKRGRVSKLVLIDYELINLGLDPLCGSMFAKSENGHLLMTVFTDEGSKHFIQVD